MYGCKDKTCLNYLMHIQRSIFIIIIIIIIIIITLLLLLLLSLLLLTAIELSLGGSSHYTSTDKTNKNEYTQMKQYKKHSQYKHTYYQNTHTLQNKLQ